MILIIDSFAILFRAYYSIPDLTTKDGFPTGAMFGTLNTVLSAIKQLNPDHIVACFDSPEDTLRKQANEEYKSNRDDAEEDFIQQIEPTKELLKTLGIHILEKGGLEADDLIGHLATKEEDEVVIITCDGDMFQLLTRENIKILYLRRGLGDTSLFTRKDAEEKIGYSVEYVTDFKGLAGDSSDNIKGVAGIGAVTAGKLINTLGDLDTIYNSIGKLKELGFTDRIIRLLEEGKESAYSSKGLATIHADINITIPYKKAKKWEYFVNKEEAINDLKKYDFDSLVIKLKNILKEEVEDVAVSELDEELLKEASVALWVLDSDKTDADHNEILAATHKDNLESAYKSVLGDIKSAGLKSVWGDIEKPLIPVIKKMEERGIKIDKKQLSSLGKKYKKKTEELRQKMFKIAGREFNPNSPKQLGEVLYDELKLVPKKKTQKRTTKESVLVSMKDSHEIIPLVLEYRHFEKLVTTYIDAFLQVLDEKDRIHTRLLQNGTTTGRLSSRSPNLQNVPNEIRKLFIPEKGSKLFSFDYSQIELRVVAMLAGEELLIDGFKNGRDIHSEVGMKVFKKDKISKQERDFVKRINFGIIYGAGARSLAESLEISLKEAQEFLDEYKKSFPKIFEYLESVKREAKITGYIETAFGRRRNILGIDSKLDFVRAQAERVAINAPVQGTGADVIKLAMVKIDKWLREEKLEDDIKMLLQIHDELLFEIKDDKVDYAINKIKELMESISFSEGKNNVKFTVDTKESWGV